MIKILTVLFLLIANVSYGAEFLVITKDSGHWSNAKKDDIIAVREDGYKWSDKEKSGLFKIIKRPDIKYIDAKKYEESLTDKITEKEVAVIRDRKYYFVGDKITSKVLTVEKTSVAREKVLAKDKGGNP